MSVVCSISGCVGNDQCPARIQLYTTLRRFFKFAEFRPGQLEATLAVLHCKDVFVRMATGSGKSLCMFLPPLATCDDSMGLVISPLNALMDQQVCSLYNIYNIYIHYSILCEHDRSAYFKPLVFQL